LREPPTVCVCEPAPRWAPELQRAFHGEEIVVRGRDLTADFEDVAAAAVAVVHLRGGALEAVLRLIRLRGQSPRRGTILLLPSAEMQQEWAWRELGADVFEELTEPNRLADVCRRRIEREMTSYGGSER